MLEEARGWMTPIIRYLKWDIFTDDGMEARKIKRMSAKYLVMVNQLYKMGRATPMLICVSEEEVGSIIWEVREGVCGSHIIGRALLGKVLRFGYYFLSML